MAAVAAGFSLSGRMIPRAVRRAVDQRTEPRSDALGETAILRFRGTRYPVSLVNTSPSGAMLSFPLVPHIGELVRIEAASESRAAHVCWVRDGHIGLSFVGGR